MAARIEARRSVVDSEAELMQVIDGKLELHKRDVMALVDAKLKAFESDTAVNRFSLDMRAPSQPSLSTLLRSPSRPALRTSASGLLPPVLLPHEPERSTPFLSQLGGPSAPATSLQRSAEKRKRSISTDSAASIMRMAAPQPDLPLAITHIRKKTRLEEGEALLPDTPAVPLVKSGPITSTPVPTLNLPVPAPSSTSFSFFRRSVGGTLHSPPPYPTSPGIKGKDTRVGALPFPLGVSSKSQAADRIPPTPPAAKTLFGTEVDGRFGDMGVGLGDSPNRKWRWGGWNQS